MSEPWLEEPYDMNDYHRETATQLCDECRKLFKELIAPAKHDYLLLDEVIHGLIVDVV